MGLMQQLTESAVDALPKEAIAAAKVGLTTYQLVDESRIEELSKTKEAKAGDRLPGLSIGAITTSLKKLNSRSHVLWKLQYQVAKLLSWRQPAFTLSILVCYTLVCLHPYLLAALPGVGLILGVMVPGFDQRHPRHLNILPLDKPSRPEFDEMGDYTPDLDPPIKPLTEEDRDFIVVLRQLQHSLNKAVEALEKVDDFVYGAGAFVNEKYSTALYLIMTGVLPVAVFFASFVPIRAFCIFNGWIVVAMCHPYLHKKAKEVREELMEVEFNLAGDLIDKIVTRDIVIDAPPEVRKVEIFELQRMGPTPRIWDPWVYTPVIYMINSPYRVSGQRPPGTRFIEDVKAPEGWHFGEFEEWVVDDATKDWVRDRAVKNVEIDIEHHWSYDYKDGVRGEWRRRRWVRNVYRDAAEPLKPKQG